MATYPRLLIPQGVQMTLQLVHEGQPAAIVLGGKADGAWGLTSSNAIAWRDAAWTAFRPLCKADVTVTGAIVRYVNTKDGESVEVGAPSSNATGGGVADNSVAAGCTLLKWRSNVGGRSGKGRTFLPGLPSAAVDADGRSYSSSHKTAAATAVSTYLSAFGTGALTGFQPAILSFRKGTANVITSGSLAPIVGIQRRRMRA